MFEMGNEIMLTLMLLLQPFGRSLQIARFLSRWANKNRFEEE